MADASGNSHSLQLSQNALWTDITAPVLFANPSALNLSYQKPLASAVADGTIDLANRSFSVALWVKRGHVGVEQAIGPNESLFNQGSSLSTNQFLHLGFSEDRFLCAFTGNDLVTSATTSDYDWHHYACTYDAATQSRNAYKDGALVGSDTANGNFAGSGPVTIGFQEFTHGQISQRYWFPGRVDEARIYATALSGDQVAALAQADPNYNPPPCAIQADLEPREGMKIPQLLQLWGHNINNCAVTYTWQCQSDTSAECPNFLASANVPPYGNNTPSILLQEGDIIEIWLTVCEVGNPSNCSPTLDRIYEGAVQ